MAEIQVEQIEIRATDLASHPAENVARAFEHTSAAAQAMSGRLTGLKQSALALAASTAGIGLGFHAIAHSVLEANKELEDTTQKIAALHFGFQSWSTSLSVVDRMKISMNEGRAVVEKLEEAESRLATPMAELARTYSALAGPAFQRLGLSQEKVLELFNRTAEASKALGVSGEMAASVITRALITGQVRGVDPFSIALKNVLGTTKHLSQQKVFERISAGMAKFAPAADVLASGIEPTLFRIKDFFEDTLRDVGTPVVLKIADTIDKWRRRIEEAKAAGHDIIREFSDKLVKGFETAERLATLILDHWRLIAGIWAANKGIGMVSGAAGALGALAGGGGLGASLGAASTGLGAFAAKLGIATTAAYALGQAFEWWLEKKGNEKMAAADKGAALENQLTVAAGHINQSRGKFFDKAGMAQLRSIPGLLDDRKRLNREAFGKYFESGSDEQRQKFATQVLGKQGAEGLRWMGDEAAIPRITDAFARMVEAAVGRMKEWQVFGPAMPENFHPPVKAAPVQNFYGDLHLTQDFKDQDPDRVFVSFKRGLEGLAENPQQSGQGSSFPY